MKTGFQLQYFSVVTDDGRNFTLSSEMPYVSKAGVRFIMPIGSTSDGASTPPILWQFLPPFGSYWPAAVLHDCAYRNTLLIEAVDGGRTVANLSKSECDNLLLEAMECCGTHVVTREEIYKGVVLGGENSFEADRAAVNAGQPVPESNTPSRT